MVLKLHLPWILYFGATRKQPLIIIHQIDIFFFVFSFFFPGDSITDNISVIPNYYYICHVFLFAEFHS